MNRKRLMHTAREVLPYVKPEQFYMGEWKCGTAACAFGHECMTRQAKAAGLRLTKEDGRLFPVFGELDGMDAAAAYYEISHDAAFWLFDPFAYQCDGECGAHEVDDSYAITPARVAARIETLLACGE